MRLDHGFIVRAKKTPGALALVDGLSGKRFSYRKTLISALLLRRQLLALPDDYIGVMLPNGAGSVLTVLAVLLAGKVPVMINFSTGAADNCAYAQEKCGFRTIVTAKAMLEKIACPVVPGMVFIEDFIARIGSAAKLSALMLASLPKGMLIKRLGLGNLDETAVVLFTSGSEKQPKGVVLSHRNIAANISAFSERFNFTDRDIIISILPYFHVFGFTVNLWLPVLSGMRMICYPSPLEYAHVVELIREEKVSILVGTPVFLMGYLKKAQKADFQSLWLVVAGADTTPAWLFDAYRRDHQLNICEGYGATETSPVISVNDPEYRKEGSIGRPLSNLAVRIADIEKGDTLPAGQEGRILVKGPSVMHGYFDDFEETSMRLKDGWYDTGDIGMKDEDGFLWHRGRLKRFVKIGGEMVSLVRTESVLVGFLPDETQCCVVEIPDFRKGARLVAAMSGQTVDTDELQKACLKVLPAIAVPKIYLNFPELPKMGSGKIDFRRVTLMVKDHLAGIQLKDG